jgi:hypothetical protein
MALQHGDKIAAMIGMRMRQANETNYSACYEAQNFGTAPGWRRVGIYNAQSPARESDYNRVTTA